ncbi:MAG: tRNA 4-thiouridine(8) synthase ThiI [Ruminococcaceae bacterium]|nr:tRNA 4-thiouridine(8) synthase ThiI [Oscillospiraceae bacterium]
MKEVILCKYGELILKGNNRASFESILLKEVRRRASEVGEYTVWNMQSTVYIEPDNDDAQAMLDEVYDRMKKIFGFVGVCRAAVCEKELDAITETAKAYLPDKLAGYTSFRCEAKRSDKRFPMASPELAGEVGGAILSVMPRLKVDLKNPDITVRVEIRDRGAYIHAGQESGAGGMPYGSAGRGLLLLSGGIDSPVAGFMMMKRGLYQEAIHFESFPYTSEAARDKVLTLASELCAYCGRMRVHVISLTKIQEALRDNCEEDYFTLLLRRFMMRLATRLAEESRLDVLVTGESLGQVASQTLKAMHVTEDAAGVPIFRPCIGMDKEEIIRISRRIGTFETSILPYEDCCTVFTPRHPRTQPELEKVLEQEALVDVAALEEEAWNSRYLRTVRFGDIGY